MAETYGKRLKMLRLAKGWTQRHLGGLVAVEHSRIAQLEGATGAKPTLELSRALDEKLGSDDLLQDLWPHVYSETFPDWSRAYMGYEARATVIAAYTGQTVHGLLQTPAYARATLRVGRSLKSAEQLEERIEGRLSRQERLAGSNPPTLWVVLDEAVLRRPVGGAAVMHEQMAQLLAVCRQPNVTVQVLPFSQGEHSAMGGSLNILTMLDGTVVAYTEGADSGQLIEDPHEVKSYGISYDQLRADALPPCMSLDMIRSVMEDSSARVPAQPRRRRLAQVQSQQPGGWGLRRNRGRAVPRPRP
ncbi:Scr1 family TA system antitoxin-like transcriptional regulator [Streptomyces sp. NPDC006711]|uniref:helix-turn-helix domain-containing protein n=1 Tax=Streptomyces sp. NPDC006711 TaxID=3364762 RepID=UPI0036B2420B